MRCTLLSSLVFAAAALAPASAHPAANLGHSHLTVRHLAHAKLSGKVVARRSAGARRQPSEPAQASALPRGAASVANLVPASSLAGLAARDTTSAASVLSSVTSLTHTGNSGTSILSVTTLLTSVSRAQSSSSKELQQSAAKAKSSRSSRANSAYQNSVYNQLKAYRDASTDLTGLSALADALAPLRANNGMANFNRDDPLQVLLRTTVTGMEDTLEAVNLIVYYVPLLGPVLGPIVYDRKSCFRSQPATVRLAQARALTSSRSSCLFTPSCLFAPTVKCIIDSILDLGEETIDGLLNELYPELHTLSGNYLSSACAMGPSLPFC